MTPPGLSKTDEEDCTICLEGLHDPLVRARLGCIPTCGHTYHYQCLLAWADRSTSCPTCRVPFHSIDILNHDMTVGHRMAVHARLYQSEAALSAIPDEFVNADTAELRLLRQSHLNLALYSRLATCTLCDRQAGIAVPESLALCDGCSGLFHIACLGVELGVPWYCPMCDLPHEGVRAPYSRQLTRPVRPSPYLQSPPVLTSRRLPTPSLGLRAVGAVRETPHGSFPLDVGAVSSALPVGDRHVYRPSPPPKRLSPEERVAWEHFDQAQRPEAATASPAEPLTGEAEPRRKYKRPTRRSRAPEAALPPVVMAPVVPKTSLVSSILSEMKANGSKITIAANGVGVSGLKLHETNPRIHSVRSLPYSPPDSPRSTEVSDSEAKPFETVFDGSLGSRLEGKRRAALPASGSESDSVPVLTFETKTRIQETVRNGLRPLYKANRITFDEYTTINQTVSRKLYRMCELFLEASTGETQWAQAAHVHILEELSRIAPSATL